MWRRGPAAQGIRKSISQQGDRAQVQLAAYPELFAGGAIIAGIPYGCARDLNEATTQCGVNVGPGSATPIKSLSPAQWGDLVRGAAAYRGAYPRVVIRQGTADSVVNALNATELMKQWAHVLGIDQSPDGESTVNGHTRRLYKDGSGKLLLETYTIEGLPHATPVDPGNKPTQCGDVEPFIVDADICSSFHIVRFWGLEQQ